MQFKKGKLDIVKHKSKWWSQQYSNNMLFLFTKYRSLILLSFESFHIGFIVRDMFTPRQSTVNEIRRGIRRSIPMMLCGLLSNLLCQCHVSLRSRRLVRAGEERASLNKRLPKCLWLICSSPKNLRKSFPLVNLVNGSINYVTQMSTIIFLAYRKYAACYCFSRELLYFKNLGFEIQLKPE
jgi:hypothetical protein